MFLHVIVPGKADEEKIAIQRRQRCGSAICIDEIAVVCTTFGAEDDLQRLP